MSGAADGVSSRLISLRGSSNRMHVLFPVCAVKRLHIKAVHNIFVQTAWVDIPAAGVRTRPVECLDATHATKEVLGQPAVEPVGGELFATRDQFKTLFGNDEMQQSLLGAHAAIALEDPVHSPVDRDLKAHRPAVAAALSRCVLGGSIVHRHTVSGVVHRMKVATTSAS